MMQGLARYGIALVFVNAFVTQAGLPVPAVPALIAAGAAAAEGHLSLVAVFVAAAAAAAIADTLWYLAGRTYGTGVLKFLCRISLSPDVCVRQTEDRFARWGGVWLLFAKFIPAFSTLAPVLAGNVRMSGPAFLAFNGLGAALWAGTLVGAGALFHAELHSLGRRLDAVGALTAGTLGAFLMGYMGYKWWRRQRTYES